MERAPRLRTDKASIVIFIIILFHVVGAAGFAVDTLQPFFLAFVPGHLMLMLVLICIAHEPIDPKFVLLLLSVISLGLGIEWLGVHKHFPFGNYAYGDTLGYKFNGVPVIIGVNWFLLTYATATTMQNLNNIFARITIGAFIMMMLDVLIEPIASRYDYWHWQNHGNFLTAPLGNYISWFAISVIMLGVFELLRFTRQSAVGFTLLIAQFAFFTVLYFV